MLGQVHIVPQRGAELDGPRHRDGPSDQMSQQRAALLACTRVLCAVGAKCMLMYRTAAQREPGGHREREQDDDGAARQRRSQVVVLGVLHGVQSGWLVGEAGGARSKLTLSLPARLRILLLSCRLPFPLFPPHRKSSHRYTQGTDAIPICYLPPNTV